MEKVMYGPAYIYEPSEATVLSDQVKIVTNVYIMDAGLTSVCITVTLHAEIDCGLSTYGRKTEDSKSWRQWRQAVMLESLLCKADKSC